MMSVSSLDADGCHSFSFDHFNDYRLDCYLIWLHFLFLLRSVSTAGYLGSGLRQTCSLVD